MSLSSTAISHLKLERASLWAIPLFLVALVYFGLSTPFITVLFGYLIISYIGKVVSKPWAIVLFAILAVVLFYLFIHFLGEAVQAIPETAEKAIPMIVDFANKRGFDMPFSDPLTLKSFVVEGVRSQLLQIAKFAQVFTKEFVYVIIGLVVTCGLFVQGEIDLGRNTYAIRNNAYSVFTGALSERFSRFFASFHTVMGAQVAISAVNTFFTGLFLAVLYLIGSPLPYSFVIVVVTFLCGLLPIIGNLISNTIIFFIGLSQSVQLGVIALSYLIILHKFEYFLNSKIIGGKIKNPMWLTLLSLLAGERLGGVPGMILAPVILHYFKMEASQLSTTAPSAD
ncbi:MAG: AI-2E family transporter [Pseudomonadota bacterium]|jgi:predicted PurR-regulated permease PerM